MLGNEFPLASSEASFLISEKNSTEESLVKIEPVISTCKSKEKKE